MVKLKLYYFDLEERGEPIRYLLHYTGQSFEDVRISFRQWHEYKQKMPFGKVPVLEIDGKLLPETFAILRYLGRKHGLNGKTEIEEAQINALADQLKDFATEIEHWYSIAAGFSHGDLDKAYNDHFVPAAEKTLSLFKRHLKDAGNGFYFRGGISWIDFVFAAYEDNISSHLPEFFNDHPEFGKHSKKIHGLAQLQNYLATRPKHHE